jgi:hypothetical protein
MKEISRIPKPIKKKGSIGMAGSCLQAETVEPLRASLKRLPNNTEHQSGGHDFQQKPMISSLVMGRRGVTEKQILYESIGN